MAPSEGSKRCPSCHRTLDASEFGPNARTTDGLSKNCRRCRQKHRDRYHQAWKDVARQARLLRRYGLATEAYDALLRRQDGRCAICREPFPPHGKRPHVDHDHQSGKVRGLLCLHCNSLLGISREDTARLHAAASYLQKWQGGRNA